MYTIVHNIPWMTFNVLLAVLGVIFGWLFLSVKNSLFKTLFCIFWLLFIPNTIYIVTDLSHLPEDLGEVGGFFKLILILQYIFLTIIGIVSFIIAVYPFEKLLNTSKSRLIKNHDVLFLVCVNFLISFGVIMGRIQRTNSWEAVTMIPKVIGDGFLVLGSTQLMMFVFICGMLCNVLYFVFRDKFMKYKILKRKAR